MEIVKKINTLRYAVHNIRQKRSPEWDNVQENHLKTHDECVACGSKEKLNVHHIKPFHLFPELELDPNNLITLCMDNECHLLIGHGNNFKFYNPNVVDDANATRVQLQNSNKMILKESAKKAKLNRQK